MKFMYTNKTRSLTTLVDIVRHFVRNTVKVIYFLLINSEIIYFKPGTVCDVDDFFVQIFFYKYRKNKNVH